MNNGESNAPGLKYKNRHIFLHLPVPPRVPRWHARPSGTAGTARIRQVYTGRTPYSTTNVARTRPHLQERSWKRSTLKRVGVAVGSHTTLGQAARHKMCRRSKSEESGRSSSDFRTCFASSILGCERGARATDRTPTEVGESRRQFRHPAELCGRPDSAARNRVRARLRGHGDNVPSEG